MEMCKGLVSNIKLSILVSDFKVSFHKLPFSVYRTGKTKVKVNFSYIENQWNRLYLAKASITHALVITVGGLYMHASLVELGSTSAVRKVIRLRRRGISCSEQSIVGVRLGLDATQTLSIV